MVGQLTLDDARQTAAILDLQAIDPQNHATITTVAALILEAAERRGGKVSANDIRDLLPLWVRPRAVSATWYAMQQAGLIRHATPDEWEPSTDRKSGNGGKPVRVWIAS